MLRGSEVLDLGGPGSVTLNVDVSILDISNFILP